MSPVWALVMVLATSEGLETVTTYFPTQASCETASQAVGHGFQARDQERVSLLASCVAQRAPGQPMDAGGRDGRHR